MTVFLMLFVIYYGRAAIERLAEVQLMSAMKEVARLCYYCRLNFDKDFKGDDIRMICTYFLTTNL